MARIDAFLKLGLAQGCSDVHLAVGVPPMLRMNGDLMPIKFRTLSDTELEAYVHEILTQSQRERLEQGHDLDFSYVAEEGGRFRVNVFRKITGVGAVFRYIPGDVPSLEKLDLILDAVRSHVMNTCIRSCEDINKAQMEGLPVETFNRRGNSAADFRTLTQEVLTYGE